MEPRRFRQGRICKKLFLNKMMLPMGFGGNYSCIFMGGGIISLSVGIFPLVDRMVGMRMNSDEFYKMNKRRKLR
ncbi:hypothetical protein A3K48_05240 [candidate division WOR-1 bacterium RIFOXYA12_FULL_52_29]|uniref:Transmembrane protein n=1 Tax=candidate division WOR-1 bacterium RIFOXYC12_FULL_54_18 TaxID=1802584 RepID=A0A1F4T723_UNCSA|nr:MAG: hypothetical protein A3K44_05240 [candidate division WOR-1 bacterium RIFOXYA2_FULL_51_19]OGC17950.1 MAG: hypothetical protein A3K48_05240 [candidate division WOR-1 bacterium RIFOXYA12_FULL_52_29]OGC26807.1 MAG: hypothetical protein A3K32_05235 [candidate division WOR-1 bacterium RIFOXYB2_FULL_45_9]OGC28367.1 MAG: hypothetical protein A3K49_05240 [candidate division WOR-1 bacterium RIFOXYC12_FULL_54_18]OGC31177.1 MAG: hypothetical protein A2346_07380 [candidate division WOR-1 bacterium R